MYAKALGAAVFMSAAAVSEALAGGALGAGSGLGGGTQASAPEIDGPAGVAAIALLVSAGLVAYNRFRK